MKRSIIAAIVVAVVVVASLGFVGLNLTTPPKPVPTEIVIGTSQPLSGGLAEAGGHTLIGILAAIDYINEVKGGVYVREFDKRLPLRLVLYDDRTETARAKSVAERLIKVDGVTAIIGPYSSLLTSVMAPVAEENKIPLVATSAWSDAIYNQGFKYVFNPYIKGSKEAEITLGWFRELANRIPIKTIAVAYSDDAYSTSVCEALANIARQQGYEVVFQEKFPVGQLDFAAMLTTIKARNPDLVVFFQPSAPGNIKFLRQFRELGLAPKAVFGGYFGDFQAVRNELGPLLETVFAHAHDLPTPLPQTDKAMFDFIYERIKKKLPWPEAAVATSGSEAVLVLAAAIEKAGTLDPAKIRDALAGIDTYFIGPVRFGPDGVNPVRVIYLVQYQNGDYRLIAPRTYPGLGIQLPVVDPVPYKP
ncbi:MAG: amino acid ABC transporter substrate-binding protein [Candidatus Caldarchaeum sp.]|nr:amino acid ABC transporter substrate-binding protein [Candidatus Caldarchaeum sp.]